MDIAAKNELLNHIVRTAEIIAADEDDNITACDILVFLGDAYDKEVGRPDGSDN